MKCYQYKRKKYISRHYFDRFKKNNKNNSNLIIENNEARANSNSNQNKSSKSNSMVIEYIEDSIEITHNELFVRIFNIVLIINSDADDHCSKNR